jgi:hypothetical protein
MNRPSQPSDASGGPPPSETGNVLLIGGSVAAVAAVWAFILFGPKGLGIWGVVVGLIVTVAIVLVTVRVRKRRAAQHLALLEQWAEKEAQRR